MAKKRPEIKSDLCTGCMLCVLSCSLFHTGRFGIGDARVVVERDDRNQRFRVRITETCTACGECAQACAYGVIGLEE